MLLIILGTLGGCYGEIPAKSVPSPLPWPTRRWSRWGTSAGCGPANGPA